MFDTVVSYGANREEGSGYVFEEPSASALREAIVWACGVYCEFPDDYEKMVRNGMRKDFSWTQSALSCEFSIKMH